MVEFLEQRGIEGATVLEVGGGVGEIQIELLKRGAARAVNLELSPAYEEEATRLLREAGFEERSERLIHDIAADPAAIDPADIIVLHRVVCCYPDHERLLGAAADHARRLLVFSYPPRNAVSRLFIAAQNLLFQSLGTGVPDVRSPAVPDARRSRGTGTTACLRPPPACLADSGAPALGSQARSNHRSSLGAPRYRRRAPTQVDEYQPLMLEIFTTSPVCGEWMNEPPPM